jgi:hypothetical protein
MWYHPSDHALHALFRRDAFPPVGSEGKMDADFLGRPMTEQLVPPARMGF